MNEIFLFDIGKNESKINVQLEQTYDSYKNQLKNPLFKPFTFYVNFTYPTYLKNKFIKKLCKKR